MFESEGPARGGTPGNAGPGLQGARNLPTANGLAVGTKRVSTPPPFGFSLPADPDDGPLDDASAWAALDALVKHGSRTQTELQEAVGVSLMTLRRVRLMLETWGLATSEEHYEGSTRYRVTYPTEEGRRVHKMREELRAALMHAKATRPRRAKGRD